MKRIALLLLIALISLNACNFDEILLPKYANKTSVSSSSSSTSSSSSLANPNYLLLDNFDSGNNTNLLGGNYSNCYNQLGFSGTLITFYYYSGIDNSLALFYGVSLADSWVALVANINGAILNLTSYKTLEFKIRASANGAPLRIQLKNKSNNPARSQSTLALTDYLPGGITTNWQTVVIPLEAFLNLDSRTNCESILFLIENRYASENGLAQSGNIYVDDLVFNKNYSGASLLLDGFNDQTWYNALGGGFFGNSALDCFTNATYLSSPSSLALQYNLGYLDTKSVHFFFGGGVDGVTGIPHDFSAYQYISVWVKGDADMRPDPIKFILNNGVNYTAKIPDDTTTPLEAIAAAWKKYRIPLMNFRDISSGVLDTTRIERLTIQFENPVFSTNTIQGLVYFDDLLFE